MKIRILQLCAVDFTVRNFLRPLIRTMSEKGYDVVSVCSEGSFFPELREEGFKMQAIPIARSMNVISHIRSIYLLYKYLKKEKFDIIHVHTPVAALIGRIAGWMAGVPLRIYTAHGFYFHDDMPPLKKKIYVFVEKAGHWFGHYIFTQSEEDRQTAIKEGICRENEIRTIGNGVDPDRFDPAKVSDETLDKLRKEFGITKENKVVAIIGRIVREKGYFEFFQAASEIIKKAPDTKFLVIGQALKSEHDIAQEEIFKYVETSGIKPNVIFAGMRKDIPELLKLADIFALPSYREGMPRSIIEAMFMAKPVVATNIRGCREEVVDGKTGYIVPAKESAPLAEAILNLLTDPAKASEFGAVGRKRALELYSEKVVIDIQLETIAKLMKK